MKIALCDLNHMTLGVHTNTAPLGIGLLRRFLLLRIPGLGEVRFYKDPARFLGDLEAGWTPDLLGIAQYPWNSELNLFAARRAKERNRTCTVVAGGPNLFQDAPGREGFLHRNSQVDICVAYDGEIPLSDIAARLLAGEDTAGLRERPVGGSYALVPGGRALRLGPGPAPRLASLDVFGAAYADGDFDRFLDDGFHPFVQTQRGCPYTCTYCRGSDPYQSRILFQSPDIFRRDLEQLGRRFAGRHEVALWMANPNFGLFPEDLDVARVIRESQERHDWPRTITVNPVGEPKKLRALMALLKYPVRPILPLQTLTPSVLRNIRRHNVPFERFVEFQRGLAPSVEGASTTALILGLPGETRDTFIETISRVLDAGVQNVVVYTLMSLRGTPLATPESRERWGHEIRHRIVPRAFSEIDGERIIESEEVVVGTNTMSCEEYLDLRALTLAVTVFSSSVEFLPVRRLAGERGLSLSRWGFLVRGDIRSSPGFAEAHASFLREIRDELFPTREALLVHYRDDGAFRRLRDGDEGDNLLRKYKTLMLSRFYGECVRLALGALRRLSRETGAGELPEAMVRDLEAYLMARDLSRVFARGYDEAPEGDLAFSYDVPAWDAHEGGKAPLESRRGGFVYGRRVTDRMRGRAAAYARMHLDPGLSLQVLYRDGGTADFWPVWERRLPTEGGGGGGR